MLKDVRMEDLKHAPLPHMLDAIKQIPSYAKFLKDLCTVKRKLYVKEMTMMNESQINLCQNIRTPIVL